MSEGDDWVRMITSARTLPPPYVTAETVIERHRTWSQAVTVVADDDQTWIVKAMQPGRPAVVGHALTAEQVVARLGHRLSASIPRVGFVNLTPEFLELGGYDTEHLAPGLAHGSLMETNCGGRMRVNRPLTDRNRIAFARLAVIYGWTGARDAQLIYKLDKAADVYSVDHGNFFPGGPNWRAEHLDADVSDGVPFSALANGCDASALDTALDAARATTDQEIAATLASSLPEWKVPEEDLVALANYLKRRRDTL